MLGGAVILVGATVSLLGAALVVRCAALLLGRGRPRRGPTPALVLAGPYLRVRNPLLGGVLLVLGGAALASRSAPLALLVLAAAAGAHAWVVGVEEPRLRARFGEAYAAYLRAVPRWAPRPWRREADAG